jgi:glycosyltransferase involved in cell wall biosynthesis
VATVHDRNTSRKRLADRRYRPIAAAVVERLIDPDRRAEPLVSCIMPTRDRRRFVPLAIEYFLRQHYPNRELVVVDDGTDRVGDLIPADPRIRYVAMPRASLGEKRNAAIRAAAGEYIAHWDDDDWYGDARLAVQMAPLVDSAADVTALSMRHVLALDAFAFWRCEPALHARLHYRDLCCGTIVFARERWEREGPYPSFNVAEDVRFLQRLVAGGARITRLDDDEHFICVRHGRNTWRIARDWMSGHDGWTVMAPPSCLPQTQLERYRAIAAATGTNTSAAVA